MKIKSQAGFTLLEILLVVVIIGMLVTIAVVQLGPRTAQARDVACREQIRNYGTALDLYELDNGFYPTTEQGLQALISPPSSPPAPQKWKGPYLKPPVLRDDPWGSKYIYKYPGEKNPTGYDLYSPGPNMVEGDADDIGNWQ